MKGVLIGFCFVLLLVACTPGPPTGNVVAPPTHYIDGSQLITADIFEVSPSGKAVRVTVTGDIVFDSVFISGTEYELSGTRAREEYLEHSGTVIAFLPPGHYELSAYSCFEGKFSWKCGCRNENDCGHWMTRELVVPN